MQDGASRGAKIRLLVDGQTVDAYEGESIAAALWASGFQGLRSSPVLKSPRGMFCNMGVCQECVVLVHGRREASCSVPVSDGLAVTLL